MGTATPCTFIPFVQRFLKFCPLPLPTPTPCPLPRPGDTWHCLETSVVVTPGGRVLLESSGWRQGWRRTSDQGQDGPTTRTTRPKVSAVPRLSLTSPVSQQKAQWGVGAPRQAQFCGEDAAHTSRCCCSLGEGSHGLVPAIPQMPQRSNREEATASAPPTKSHKKPFFPRAPSNWRLPKSPRTV